MWRTFLGAALALLAAAAQAQIVEPGGRLVIGYHADARPFSYENESGKPVGYAAEICQKVVEIAKAEVGLADERISWVSVTSANRLDLLRKGSIKVLCGEPVTLSAGKEFAFSMPIFQGGVGALVRSDAPADLVAALSGGNRPVPGGSTVAAVRGAPAQAIANQQLGAQVMPVKDYAQGVQAVLERKASVFFADRSVLLDAVRRNPSFDNLKVMDRRYTTAPVAIALKRGNDDARLAVDRALSRLYRDGEWRAIYVKWFGEPDADTIAFFRLSVLPE
jgi:putrescine:ornithine antiporter